MLFFGHIRILARATIIIMCMQLACTRESLRNGHSPATDHEESFFFRSEIYLCFCTVEQSILITQKVLIHRG